MSMFIRPPQMTGNPFIDRIVQKRDATHAEIHTLREELQVLKDVLRSKQDRLRKMNKAIISRYHSSHYLQLVSSQPIPRQSGETTKKPAMLYCLDGGKA